MRLENKIEAINGDECDHGKDYMKIKFISDDDLPLKKLLKFRLMTIKLGVFLVRMVYFTLN